MKITFMSMLLVFANFHFVKASENSINVLNEAIYDDVRRLAENCPKKVSENSGSADSLFCYKLWNWSFESLKIALDENILLNNRLKRTMRVQDIVKVFNRSGNFDSSSALVNFYTLDESGQGSLVSVIRAGSAFLFYYYIQSQFKDTGMDSDFFDNLNSRLPSN